MSLDTTTGLMTQLFGAFLLGDDLIRGELEGLGELFTDRTSSVGEGGVPSGLTG